MNRGVKRMLCFVVGMAAVSLLFMAPAYSQDPTAGKVGSPALANCGRWTSAS